MAVDVFDDDGKPRAGRGRRAGVHQAVAGHDPGPLQRPRALPRDVLDPLARRVGARRLGDRGRRRRRWYLHGRSDDTIKVAGKRLGPAEVESALVSHPAVVEAAAVGMPDEVKGEALWGYVVLAPGAEPPTRRCGPSSPTSWPRSSASRSARPPCGSSRSLPKTRSAKVRAPGDPGRGAPATTRATCRRSRTRRASTRCGRRS